MCFCAFSIAFICKCFFFFGGGGGGGGGAEGMLWGALLRDRGRFFFIFFMCTFPLLITCTSNSLTKSAFIRLQWCLSLTCTVAKIFLTKF